MDTTYARADPATHAFPIRALTVADASPISGHETPGHSMPGPILYPEIETKSSF